MTSKFILTATALVMGVAAVSLPASADSYDRTDVRQANQAKRIQQGIRSGELTRAEVRKLEAQQAKIREMERKAERDGHITRAERARIEAAQDAASRSIYREKHDAEDRDRHFGKRRWFNRFSHNEHGQKRWYRRWF